MPRYVAFLRGVSPQNAKMPELTRCFEAAGFLDVRTLLSSGNVAFSTRTSSLDALERRAVKAMHSELGRSFGTIVRSTQHLQDLVVSDPFTKFKLPATAKHVVTFLRQPPDLSIKLPIERDGASILALVAAEVFSAYVPSTSGPILMNLLERAFGKDITTRTLETVKKCSQA